MTYNSNILLGRIVKATGFEGAVKVKLERVFFENIPHMESVFLEIEGRQVPFFISNLEYNGADILKLKFEGYDSLERIREYSGCRIFLTSNDPVRNNLEDTKNLAGYKVLLENNTVLGSVTEVIKNPGQSLLKIISLDNNDILIPFHEHFIVSIDIKDKIIVMDIPEGLTEIN